MSTVRLKRLMADYDLLLEYVRNHPRVTLVQADGDPPERYQLRYRIRSLRKVDDELRDVEEHLVEIALSRHYPRTPPQCRMLTPVFHPNIAPHAICIGDHWSAGETLASLAIRIGEILAYQAYNTKSPLNGEAARWTAENLDRLPTDRVSLLPLEREVPKPPPLPPQVRPSGSKTTPPPLPPSVKERRVEPEPVPIPDPPPLPVSRGAPPTPELEPESPPEPAEERPSEKVVVVCPMCTARIKLPVRMLAESIQCPRCETLFRGRILA